MRLSPEETSQLNTCSIPPHIKSVVRAKLTVEGKALSNILPLYQLIPKGSLWNPDIQHVSDLDILLKGKSSASLKQDGLNFISKVDIQRMVHVGSKLVGTFQGQSVTKEVLAPNTTKELEQMNGVTAMVFTFVYKPPGMTFVFPLDITLSSEQNDEEEVKQRLDKLSVNCQTGDYAKALQRVLPLLARIIGKKSSKALRSTLLQATNDSVGRIRFFYKQLDIVAKWAKAEPMGDWQTYLQRVLCVNYRSEVCIRACMLEKKREL